MHQCYSLNMVPYERFDSWKLTHKLALAIYRSQRGLARVREIRDNGADPTGGSLCSHKHCRRLSEKNERVSFGVISTSRWVRYQKCRISYASAEIVGFSSRRIFKDWMIFETKRAS